MKRAVELRGLSEQHHHGLVAARGLRLAAEGKRPLPDAVAAFLVEWEREIQPHFRAEEEVLLPEFARFVAADHPLIARTCAEHVALRRAVRALTHAAGEAQRHLAAEIGRSLDDHIRFEERVLFPAIEEALQGPALVELGEELPRQGSGSCRITPPAGP